MHKLHQLLPVAHPRALGYDTALCIRLKPALNNHPLSHSLARLCAALCLLTLAMPTWAFDAYTVSAIEVRGLAHTEVGTVYNYLPVKVGKRLDAELARAAVAALYATDLFEDVQLGRDGDRLVVTVRERPVIASVSVSGVSAFPQDRFKDSLKDLGLTEARIFNRATLEQVTSELERQYYSTGYYAAKIKVKADALEGNRIAVRIDVDEGDAAVIREVSLIGNHAFADAVLLAQFELSKTTAFSGMRKNDQYSRQKLEGDIEKLRSYYMDRGYLDFDIESTQVTITPDRRAVFVAVSIREGALYHVDQIDIGGETQVPLDELRKLIKTQPGALFSRREIIESADAIEERLGNDGFAFASANPVPRIDKDTHKVSFDFQVRQGQRVYVRRIHISGNEQTRDYVVRREFRQLEGAWYDTGKVKRSRERVNRLGFFEDVTIDTVPVPDAPDQVDIDVKVKERSTGQFSLAIGYSSGQGLLFNGSVSLTNLLGRGQTLSASADFSGITKSYNLSFTEPYITPDGISLGGDLYRTDTNTQRLDISRYRQTVTGVGLRVGLPVTEQISDTLRLAYDDNKLDLNADAPPSYKNLVATYGNRFSSLKFGNVLAFDSRDSVLFPTSGWYDRLSTEIALPSADLRYYRVELQTQYYQPMPLSMFSLVNVEYGFVNGYAGKPVPLTQNFYMGGTNSVRGYRTYSLGPQEDDLALGASRKAQLNMELFSPVPGAGDSASTKISLFFDAGWVYDGDYKVPISQVRKSVGIGFSWMSPLGPLRFSWAKAIDARPVDKLEGFQWTIGSNF